MHLLSTLALKGTVEELLPRLQAVAGEPIEWSFDPTAVTLRKIRDGARGDAAILTEPGIVQLITDGVLVRDTRVDIAHSLIGLAVKSGAPKPAIATLDDFVRTLRAARSLVYSKGGASGIFFAGLLEQLGLKALVDAKATIIASGFTAEPVARGEAEMAIQQISELMTVAGVDIVGPLPDGAQESLLFSGAVFADLQRADPRRAAAAHAVLDLLAARESGPVLSRRGMLPLAR